MRSTKTLAAMTLILTGLMACAETDGPAARSSITSTPVDEVLERIASPRLASLDASGSVATVSGFASDRGADLTRTLWYEDIAAVASAQLVPVSMASRTVIGSNGQVLTTEEDPVSAGSRDALGPSHLTEADIWSIIRPSAKLVGANVVTLEYVDLFGGTAEIVVQPGEVDAFVADAGSRLTTLLDRLADNQHPYLVTVVDAAHEPQLVIGYVPGIGGDGQGLAWVKPGLETNAIFGMLTPSDNAAGAGS